MARILHNNGVKFPKDFFSIVMSTNMAAMTSSENHLYKSSEEPVFGIFAHYSTRPIYDVSMNLFCWPPSVDFCNILPGFLWQPFLNDILFFGELNLCLLYPIIGNQYRWNTKKSFNNILKVRNIPYKHCRRGSKVIFSRSLVFAV